MKVEIISGREMLKRFNELEDLHEVRGENEFVWVTSGGTVQVYRREDWVEGANPVWVVLKNYDFTEGRGPMVFHKIFKEYDDAVTYIMGQYGVYGSPQGPSNYPGCSMDGFAYCVSGFNGYEIRPTTLE